MIYPPKIVRYQRVRCLIRNSGETQTVLIDHARHWIHNRPQETVALRRRKERNRWRSGRPKRRMVMNQYQTLTHGPRAARIMFLAVLSTVLLMATPSFATGNVVKADLAGSWQVTLYGQGGCGVGTTLVTFTLNASGSATNAVE